jgi:Protein of unknown function (DUF429)
MNGHTLGAVDCADLRRFFTGSRKNAGQRPRVQTGVWISKKSGLKRARKPQVAPLIDAGNLGSGKFLTKICRCTPVRSVRAPLERRTTDVLVYRRTGKPPLSVTTDRIAYCATRCASILGALKSAKDGSGAIVEAYPDAALRCWLPELFTDTRQSYKTKNNIEARQRHEALLDALLDQLGDAFKITGGQRFDIAYSDDCLDALLCA